MKVTFLDDSSPKPATVRIIQEFAEITTRADAIDDDIGLFEI